eukprot:NODE_26441_length_550_cov_97.451537.p3 GENE.NODE_26441_length_550_cov_97.451537~~NODE_26441_length_550_cov_97.451537.p3  ORF type:complete len:63 (-),score=11.42 NODE_26441_length_550_cov_97.451537:87-275(-)
MHAITMMWSKPEYEQEPTKTDDTAWTAILSNTPQKMAQSIRIRVKSGAGISDWADYELGVTE